MRTILFYFFISVTNLPNFFTCQYWYTSHVFDIFCISKTSFVSILTHVWFTSIYILILNTYPWLSFNIILMRQNRGLENILIFQYDTVYYPQPSVLSPRFISFIPQAQSINVQAPIDDRSYYIQKSLKT
jgi:hypothetical protein